MQQRRTQQDTKEVHYMAFIDRVVEHPGRFTLTNADNGEVLGTFDFARAEGTVTTEGTQLNAANLNQEISDAVTQVTESIGDSIDSRLSAFSIDANQNVSIRNIQRGSTKISAKKNKVFTKHVNFPKAFTAVPSVVITPVSAAPNKISSSVKNITTKGFDLCLYRSSDSDTSFCWMAVL
jgi:hypothetical protein